jgi:ParB family chromosome partitioning protein
LAASIRGQGIMQPILVRPIANKRYEIIAGERRWRASQIAGLGEVPVQIRDIPDESALVMSLIENIQREDLNPLEEAAGIQRLIEEFGMSHQQAADSVGRSRPSASNLLRLLQLTKPAQDMLMAGDIDMGHARALLPLSKPEQARIAALIADKGLSVREAERLVAHELNPPTRPQEHQKPNRDLARLEESVADALGATVKITANRKGAGAVTIRFSNLDQLDGILERFLEEQSSN